MITDKLRISLSNHIEASLIVKGYHWNIEGLDFQQFHNLFDEIYEDYYEQIDTLAEYIRAISDTNDYVNGSVEIVALNKTRVSHPLVGDKAELMVGQIIIINNALINDFMELMKEPPSSKVYGLQNYAQDRLNALTKLNWKLLAITKQ